MPASQGFKQRSNKLSASCSNFARVNFLQVFRHTIHCCDIRKIDLCFSRRRSIRLLLFQKLLSNAAKPSDLCAGRYASSFLNSSASQSMITLSKSSPPRCVSPLVLLLQIHHLPIQGWKYRMYHHQGRIQRSYDHLLPLSNHKPSAAAVGSFTIRRTFKPAISPASFVAWRCASLK